MSILSRPRFLPQQRLDLEDVNALLSALRTDSKLQTKQMLSTTNMIFKGFSVTGIGLKNATVNMADATLIIPQNSNDFSWFTSAPSEPNVLIPDADLVDGTRNYVEIQLTTENNTPLTKAFWDPEANSGAGSEFNQIVETVTDLKCNFVVSTGGFSGSPDRLPLAIIDTDGSGTIKTIFDRRILFGRLAKPSDIDNRFTWGTKEEPSYAISLTGASGTFIAGEDVEFLGGATPVFTLDYDGITGSTIAPAGGADTGPLSTDRFQGNNFVVSSTINLGKIKIIGGAPLGTPTGNVVLDIYASVGNVPSGAVLYTSDPIASNTITLNNPYEFSFAGAGFPSLPPGNYCWAARGTNTDLGNAARIRSTGLPPSTPHGRAVAWNGTVWSSVNYSNYYEVYSEALSGGTLVATAKVVTGGTSSIAVNVPDSIAMANGQNVVGQTSGATGVVNTIYESFTGVDKNLKTQKDINDALMTEFANIKGKRFWWEDAGLSLIGISNLFESVLVQATATAKFAWDGALLKITDDNVTPGNDTLGYIRIMGRGDDLGLTREDGTGGTSSLAIADGQVLYVKIPASGDRNFSASGSGTTNYQVAAIGSYVSADENYWLAYREGTRLYIRGYGELQPGEEINIGDPELEEILAQIAANLASSNQDRTMKMVEGGTWNVNLAGTALTLSAAAYIQIPGLLRNRNTIAAQTISLPNATSVAYVSVNRSGVGALTLTVNVANEDAVTLGNNDLIIARRVPAGILVGEHSFLLKAGEYLELDGALSEINRYMGQLKIKRHATDVNKALINPADSALLNGATLSQVIDNFLLDFSGAVINFTSGVITKEDGVTALGTNFTPFTIPVGQYFWYGISLNPGDVNANNTQGATVQIDPADSANAVQANALRPVITGSIKLGAIQVQNIGGTITVVDVKPLGVGSGSGGGSGQGSSFDAEVRTYLKLSPYEFAEMNIFAVDQKTKIDLVNSTGAYAPATKTFKMTTGQTMQSIELLDPDFISATRALAKARVILRYASVVKSDDAPVVEIQKNGGAFTAVTMTRIGLTDTYDGEIIMDAAVGTSMKLKVTASEASEIFAYAVMYDTTFVSVPVGIQKYISTDSFSGDLNKTIFPLTFTPDPNTIVVYDKKRGQSYIYDPTNTFGISGTSLVFVADFFNFPGETIDLEFRQIVGNGFDNSDDNANAIASLDTRVSYVEQRSMNYAQNAEFRLWQRQNAAVLTNRQDAAYSADRWKVLTSGGAVNVSGARVQDSPIIPATRYAGQFRQADATARQIGLCQVLESDRVWALRGQQVTFNFRVKAVAAQIPNIRASIVEWTGTADTITSDLVSSWSATPTLVANASHVSSISDFAMNGNWLEFSVTANLTNNFTNLALMIWTPATCAQNSDLFVTQIQLVRGLKKLWPDIQLSPERDLLECQKFFEKNYDTDVAPGTPSNLGIIGIRKYTTGSYSTTFQLQFRVIKRVIPTVTFYQPTTGAVANWRNQTGTTMSAVATDTGMSGCLVNLGATSDDSVHYGFYTAEAEL